MKSSTVIVQPRSYQFGRAWIALTIALAAHVADEAATGFLSFYNPTVLAIRERLPSFAMPRLPGTTTAPLLIAGGVRVLAVAVRGAK